MRGRALKGLVDLGYRIDELLLEQISGTPRYMMFLSNHERSFQKVHNKMFSPRARVKFQVVFCLSFCQLSQRDRVEIATSDDSDDFVGFRVDDDEVSK